MELEPQFLEVVSTSAQEVRTTYMGLQAGVWDAKRPQGRGRDWPHSRCRSFDLGGIPSNASGHPRIDQVIGRVLDQSHDGSGLRKWRLEYVAGVGTSGATIDNRNGAITDVALGNNWLRLADVRQQRGHRPERDQGPPALGARPSLIQ